MFNSRRTGYPEFAAVCMEQNAAKTSDMPTITYVATGWTPAHPNICKNIDIMMAEELGHLIETGTYSIPGFDANANEPASTQKRPELDDSMFKICKPRYSSKELAIMESELARVQALFGIDPILKKTLQETVQAFDKAHTIHQASPGKSTRGPTKRT